MDTGSSDCYIDRRFADKHTLNLRRAVGEVTLAETSVRMPIRGQCITHWLKTMSIVKLRSTCWTI